ncbi:hypothetical protein [Streptomyces goshikiensis]|uniref:hypothetical protein n=1 Tax=Streptomyces goshikiensis TaxID=1942 RepID=UPI0036A8E29E
MLLTYAQVRAYELPATEGEHGAPGWPAAARRYGFDPARPVQWEVEARLVLDAVHSYIDRDGCVGQKRLWSTFWMLLAIFIEGGGGTAFFGRWPGPSGVLTGRVGVG